MSASHNEKGVQSAGVLCNRPPTCNTAPSGIELVLQPAGRLWLNGARDLALMKERSNGESTVKDFAETTVFYWTLVTGVQITAREPTSSLLLQPQPYFDPLLQILYQTLYNTCIGI